MQNNLVYVTNIAHNTEHDIKSLFAFCGPIIAVTSHQDYFVIIFQEEKATTTALLLDKTPLNGTSINVSLSVPPPKTPTSSASSVPPSPQKTESFKSLTSSSKDTSKDPPPARLTTDYVPIPFAQAPALSKQCRLGPHFSKIIPIRSTLFAAPPDSSILVTQIDPMISDTLFFYSFLFCGEIKQYSINRQREIALVHFEHHNSVMIAKQLGPSLLNRKTVQVHTIPNLDGGDNLTSDFISLFSFLVIPSMSNQETEGIKKRDSASMTTKAAATKKKHKSILEKSSPKPKHSTKEKQELRTTIIAEPYQPPPTTLFNADADFEEVSI